MFTDREFSDETTRAYYKFARRTGLRDCDHEGHSWKECPELRFMFNRAFFMGAQYATQVSGELAPYLARFVEFMMWVTEKEEVNGYQYELPE